MVTPCDASDGVLRDHARGTWDVVPSVTMLSQHAAWNTRHVHMARRKRVLLPHHAMLMWHGGKQTELPVVG